MKGLRRAALAALLIATACAHVGETRAGAEPAPVRDLGSISALQDRFDHDAGAIRLVLLISPT
jgi:hypothetical protein